MATKDQKVRPSTLASEIVTITPDMALQWLDKYSNGRNPPIRQNNVRMFAQEMKAKKWALNGESMSFDWNGNIHDGHHRLWACIEAGVPFTTLVVRGVNPDTFTTVDTGRSRTWADTIFVDGVKSHHRPIATAVGLCLRYNAGKIVTNAKIPNRAVAEYAADHPDLGAWVEAASKGAMKAYAAPLAAVVYLAAGKYRARGVEFIDKMVTGVKLEAGHPCLALRERLHHDKGLRSSDRLALIILGWNAFIEGRKLSRMQMFKGDKFPKIRGAHT